MKEQGKRTECKMKARNKGVKEEYENIEQEGRKEQQTERGRGGRREK